MKSLSLIEQINLPFSCINSVYEELRNAGKDGNECVALFAGEVFKNSCTIDTWIVPEQEAHKHSEGLMYTVGEDELYRINKWLYKNNKSLIAQIHSHPGLAYHSETDDRYPIIAKKGGFSIVIPDFGFHPISVKNWAVYRLNEFNTWVEVNSVDKLIIINK